MSEPKRIVNEVSLLVEPLLSGFGMEMVDVEFQFERGRWILRVFIDKQGGVTIDDCASISRELGDLIEAENIINLSYVLEVSSPGLNRPLRKEDDFIRSIGKMVQLKMSRPINKRRNFAGRLTNVRKGMISLVLEDNNLVELPLTEIDKARLKYEFDNYFMGRD
ncbi:MAG: ribosome maturation factor RimP [Deltaproteobacteria bacterium]|nr:ribosome maturation factor RimP [Deltaproteobacteria bacterium]MBW2104567.1 ribosome maturation factor RimP [Deltaproteobacteria bacterium]MCD6265688.1 ribosome maturation factor RimP [Deltaproteobacteria bacterium]